jgi:hypothetical protein
MLSVIQPHVIYQLLELRSENHTPPIPVVEFAFERLSLQSPFLKLLVAWCTWHRDSALALTVDSLDALPQFSSALVIAMVAQRHAESQDPFSGKLYVYYESNDKLPNETTVLDLNSCQACISKMSTESLRYYQRPLPSSLSNEDEDDYLCSICGYPFQ